VKRADPTVSGRFRTAPVLAVAMALSLATPIGAVAQDKGTLNKLEREIKAQQDRAAALRKKLSKLATELKVLRRQSIDTARATQDSETLLTRLESQLTRTQKELAEREAALQGQTKQFGGTLSALERLSRNPPQALLMSQGKPIEVVRRAMLLRAALPVIQNRADDLRTKISALAETRADVARQLDVLKNATDDYAGQRIKLTTLIQRKADLLKQTKSEERRTAKRIQRLGREAKNLKELFARLEAERPPPPTTAPAPPSAAIPAPPSATPPPAAQQQTALLSLPRPDALRPFPDQGSITTPARGKVTRQYGEANEYGNTAKGITITTRVAASIVAPYDGKVVFAGPFKGYGQILIIEHSGGYHTLLAGMANVDTSVGQWLLAGEPVGAMANSDKEGPRLYFELRRRGQPVNPLPWFVEYRKRVRG